MFARVVVAIALRASAAVFRRSFASRAVFSISAFLAAASTLTRSRAAFSISVFVVADAGFSAVIPTLDVVFTAAPSSASATPAESRSDAATPIAPIVLNVRINENI